MSGRLFKSFSVGLFTIIPAADPITNQCDLPIVLGTRGAFGSGEHETTVACLELLPTIPDTSGSHVLDLGSGTGILAIAAARLGAGEVVALDLDPAAAVSCRENVELNGLAAKITTVCGDLAGLDVQTFDLVLANIYADILINLADQLVAMTRAGGYLLVSGIPLQDKFDIVQRYARLGCCVRDSRIGQDFATYLLHKG